MYYTWNVLHLERTTLKLPKTVLIYNYPSHSFVYVKVQSIASLLSYSINLMALNYT